MKGKMMTEEQKPMDSPPVDATMPDPALETQPIEVDTNDESTPEEHDHAEIYDDEEDSLDEANFDAPEQNAKEVSS